MLTKLIDTFVSDVLNVELEIFQDDSGDYWFHAATLCDILKLSNPTVTIQRHVDDDWRKKFPAVYGKESWYVMEPGLYQLVHASDSPAAKRFQRWVFGDVLKKLRSQGYYAINDVPLVKEPALPLLVKESLTVVDRLITMVEMAKSTGNMRILQQAENGLSQYYDAYISLNQTQTQTALPMSEQVNKRFESIIDVAIRLGKNIPSNLESSLGRYAGKFIGHLREEQKDNRTASASGKRLNVYLYPANSFDVEQCVLDYCDQKGI